MKILEKEKGYFETYTRETYFQDRILLIRKKLGIPPEGIEPSKGLQASSFFLSQDPVSVFGIKLDHINYQTSPRFRDPVYNELLEPIPQIYQTFNAILFINAYILYNKRFYDVFQSVDRMDNSVDLTKFRIDFLEHETGCQDGRCPSESYLGEKSEKYPVMIGISPYASQNEVIDFIKKQWSNIQEHFTELAKYNYLEQFEKDRSRLSKIRSRKQKSREVEDFVYENRTLSLKQLSRLVKKELGVDADEGSVGKIRSLAIKRRKAIGK